MSTLYISKVVSNLPTTLTPNTIYFLRKGNGMEIYCSDSSGNLAHTTNKFYPPSVTGDQSLTLLSADINSEITHYYLQPLSPRTINISESGILEGKSITLVNRGSSTLEVLIDGITTDIILSSNGVLDLHYANSEWHIMVKY